MRASIRSLSTSLPSVNMTEDINGYDRIHAKSASPRTQFPAYVKTFLSIAHVLMSGQRGQA